MQAAPAASRAENKSTRAKSPQARPDHPAFPARWFYGFFRALPGDRLCCRRRTWEAITFQELDIGIEISGPHDFAVRAPVTRQLTAAASIASRANVRDDRDTPLLRARDARSIARDLPDAANEIRCGTMARRANHLAHLPDSKLSTHISSQVCSR
jgi:hypothetical protein